MNFDLNEEQKLIIKTTKDFVKNELYPHESLVERNGFLPKDLIKEIQGKAIKAGITEVSFDRGGYLYHGRVKSLAEGAREAGLKF